MSPFFLSIALLAACGDIAMTASIPCEPIVKLVDEVEGFLPPAGTTEVELEARTSCDDELDLVVRALTPTGDVSLHAAWVEEGVYAVTVPLAAAEDACVSFRVQASLVEADGEEADTDYTIIQGLYGG